MSIDRRRIWRVIRIVWVTAGVGAVVAMAYGMSTAPLPPDSLTSDARVEIVQGRESIDFRPRPDDPARVGLIFFPGGLVSAEAYAPMARRIAEQGHPVSIVRLPWRMAPTPAYEEMAFRTARETIAASHHRWAVGGHSRGGMLSTKYVERYREGLAGLILVGTTHPRERDLSWLEVPVLKVYASHDGVATPADVRRYAANLPATATFVEIDGGNHRQFGYYRYQLMDGRATMTRDEQQARLVEAVVGLLQRAQAQP